MSLRGLENDRHGAQPPSPSPEGTISAGDSSGDGADDASLLLHRRADSFDLENSGIAVAGNGSRVGAIGSVAGNEIGAVEVDANGYHVVGSGQTGSLKEGKRAEILRVFGSIRTQLMAVALYSFFALSKNLVFFPFIRTTIVCASTAEAANQHSSEWSGSAKCPELAFVARDAQFIKGLAEGLDQAVHCLMLPFLGHMLDVVGRRWGVLTGMIGLLLQSLCFWAATFCSGGTISHVWIVLGSIIQGSTGIFMAGVNASVRDMQIQESGSNIERSVSSGKPTDHASTAYGLVQVSQGASNAFAMAIVVVTVLSHNLSAYNTVWFIFCLAIMGAIGWLYFFFPESLPSHVSSASRDAAEPPHQHGSLGYRQHWDWRKASPWSLVELFLDTRTRYLAAGTFFILLSISSLSTLQAFTVATYHWTQTYSTVVFTVLSPIAVVSIAASFILIPRVGPKAVIGGSLLFLNLGSLSLCFAPLSPAFCFIAMAFFFATSISIPAFMQIVTGMTLPHETGQLLANIGAVALAAVALGNLLYGTLFRHFAETPSLSFILGFPIMLLATACACKSSAYIK